MCMKPDYTCVHYVVDGPIARITMERPDGKMNVLDVALATELAAALREAQADDQVKVVVLTGSGKAFCAGGDLAFFQTLELQSSIGFVDLVQDLARAFLSTMKPVIAAVNGAAAGAGFSFVLLCDLVVSSEKAKYGSAFINVGLVPDMGAMYFLPRIVGLPKAKEMVFTGKNIDAMEAQRIGIVNQVVAPEELTAAADALAAELASKPAHALSVSKKILNQSLDMNLNSLFEVELLAQGTGIVSPEAREGVDAFLNKRAPKW